MFCAKCGTENQGAAFCQSCGNPQTPAVIPSSPMGVSKSNSLSTTSIVFGAIAFLFVPLLFGSAGLIIGAVAKTRKEERSTIALVVSGTGLVVGSVFGYIMGYLGAI